MPQFNDPNKFTLKEAKALLSSGASVDAASLAAINHKLYLLQEELNAVQKLVQEGWDKVSFEEAVKSFGDKQSITFSTSTQTYTYTIENKSKTTYTIDSKGLLANDVALALCQSNNLVELKVSSSAIKKMGEAGNLPVEIAKYVTKQVDLVFNFKDKPKVRDLVIPNPNK